MFIDKIFTTRFLHPLCGNNVSIEGSITRLFGKILKVNCFEKLLGDVRNLPKTRGSHSVKSQGFNRS